MILLRGIQVNSDLCTESMFLLQIAYTKALELA